MSFISKLFGDSNARYVKSHLGPLVHEVNLIETEFEKLSDDDLRGMTAKFRERLTRGEMLDDLLVEAFAAVREAARRVLGQRHFDVQLIGGVALHLGKITEMRTGEGKTLVATAPLYLNSLAGKGAHLVTPNDYLSRIGAGWMGAVYYRLGTTVGVITHDFSGVYDPAFEDAVAHGDARLNHFRPCTRREAYLADITYGTNNEFGFDYLRDNLEYEPGQLRQREHFFAIVDEVDSILIDEARTPLIISMPDTESADLYGSFSRIVPQLKSGTHYNVDEKLKAVAMTEEGIDRVEQILGVGNIYEEKGVRFVRHLEQALRAQALFHRDRDYVVKPARSDGSGRSGGDGEVIIVDEFTGRLMPGRRWSEGLHQAVEAKEGVKVQQESRTLATITFQNFFRMYTKLAGMTGTAETSAEEFHKVYNLDVVSIPTNRAMIRKDGSDLVFRTEKGKFQAVVREVKERHAKGQPVLIGTVSIEKNERLSKMLNVEGISHELLNAKNHEREAMIIAEAGRKGAVTVATNMAGRGVDIILGGISSDSPEAEEVRNAGGLMVIGTERHEARRIDNQLRGRAGRQGDPGVSQFFVSLEDELMRVFGSERIKRMMETLGIPEDQSIENRMVSRAIESAQAKIEGFHFDSRKHVLDYDDVLNKQRDAIYRMRRDNFFEGKMVVVPTGPDDSSRLGREGEEPRSVSDRVREMIEEEIRRVVEFHSAGDTSSEWNVEEMFENARAMAGSVGDETRTKLGALAALDASAEEKRSGIVVYLWEVLSGILKAKEEEMGADTMRRVERLAVLRSIDMLWMDHLDQMAHLQDSVRLRAYGQRDPLVEYKHEGAKLFRELQQAIRTQVANSIFKVSMQIGGAPMASPRIELKRNTGISSGLMMASGDATLPPQSSSSAMASKEPNRNDPCPCGSGKKYKKCHGA